MQLVGATNSFVRIPFLVGGALQGFLGAVVGLLLVMAAFFAVDSQFRSSDILGVAFPKLLFLGPVGIAGVIVVGIVVGAVGSLFALGRFLDV